MSDTKSVTIKFSPPFYTSVLAHVSVQMPSFVATEEQGETIRVLATDGFSLIVNADGTVELDR